MAILLGFIHAGSQPLPMLIPYHDGDLWGYADSLGKIIIMPQWNFNVDLFRSNKAYVYDVRNGHIITAIIDSSGQEILPLSRNWTGWYNDTIPNLNSHNDSGLWGMIDTNNRIIIPYEYQLPDFSSYPSATNPYENLSGFRFYCKEWKTSFLIAGKKGHMGIIDRDNHVRIPFRYRKILPPSSSIMDSSLYFIVYGDDYKMGVLDASGKVVVPLQYDDVYFENASNGIIRPGFYLKKGDYTGWASFSGDLFIKPEYQSVLFFPDSFIAISRAVKCTDMIDCAGIHYGLLDKNGKLVIPPDYCMLLKDKDSVVTCQYRRYGKKKKTIQTVYYLTAGKKRKTISYEVPAEESQGRYRLPFPEYTYHQNDIPVRTELPQINYIFHVSGKRYDQQQPAIPYTPETTAFIVTDSFGNYGVITRSQHFIIPPQKRFKILGGDIDHNLLLVQKDSLYGITDTNLNVLLALQPHRPDVYFTWKEHVIALSPNKYGHRTLIAHDGRTPNAFCNIFIGQYLDSMLVGQGGSIFQGYFTAFDSMGNMGFVDVEGHVYFPGVSFRHPYMERTPQGTLLVSDAGLDNRYLVASNGNAIFTDIYITNISGKSPIFRYDYKSGGTGNAAKYFYVDHNGMIYARNLK